LKIPKQTFDLTISYVNQRQTTTDLPQYTISALSGVSPCTLIQKEVG